MMLPVRRLNLIEISMLMLILISSLLTAVTEARYVSLRQGFDQARVARPVIHVSKISHTVDPDEIEPGGEVYFEFAIDNGTVEGGITEVALDYRIALAIQSPSELPWEISLDWLDESGAAFPCQQVADRAFFGFEPLEPRPMLHHYRLRITLPANAELPNHAVDHSVEVSVTASQRNA